MAADGFVQIIPDSTGKNVDTSELTVNSKTVERQRIVIADPTGATNLATVSTTGNLQTQDISNVTIATTVAPSQILITGGKTNDATPQYQPIPLGPSGESVIVEGYASGVAIPIAPSSTAITNPLYIQTASEGRVSLDEQLALNSYALTVYPLMMDGNKYGFELR